MKLSSIFLFSFGAHALRLPNYHVSDEDDGTQDLRTRITAFIVDDNGNPKIECWEVGASTETMEVKRKDGSVAHAYRSQLTARDEVNVEILSWPPYTPIWPPPSDYGGVRTAGIFDGLAFYKISKGIISVAGGLFGENVTRATADREAIFGPGSGDDWFYFEDSYSSSSRGRAHANLDESPFSIRTVSGANTQLLRISHAKQPSYKKLHDGGCGYSGVTVPSSSSSSGSGNHIEVNLKIQEL